MTTTKEDILTKLMEEQKKILSDIIREFGIDEQGAITVRPPFDREKRYFIDGFWHKILPYVFMKISLLSPTTTKEDDKNSLRADMFFFPRLKNALTAAEEAIDKMSEAEFNEYKQSIALAIFKKDKYVLTPFTLVDNAKKLYKVEYKEPIDKKKISKTATKEFRRDLETAYQYLNQCSHSANLSRLKAVYELDDMKDIYSLVIYAELKLLNIKKEMFQYFGEEELKGKGRGAGGMKV